MRFWSKREVFIIFYPTRKVLLQMQYLIRVEVVGQLRLSSSSTTGMSVNFLYMQHIFIGARINFVWIRVHTCIFANPNCEKLIIDVPLPVAKQSFLLFSKSKQMREWTFAFMISCLLATHLFIDGIMGIILVSFLLH